MGSLVGSRAVHKSAEVDILAAMVRMGSGLGQREIEIDRLDQLHKAVAVEGAPDTVDTVDTVAASGEQEGELVVAFVPSGAG